MKGDQNMGKRKIIIGTDWWTDCDDAAAIAIACRLAKKGFWEIEGIVMNAVMDFSAASLDGFVRSELESSEHPEIPLGIDLAATDFGREPKYQVPLAKLTGSTKKNSDCEDGVKLMRRLLSEADDGKIELIEIGYEQVLAALLESAPDEYSVLDGRKLIARKVKRVWVMGGKWPEGRENNFTRAKRAVDGAAALWNDDEFPVEAIFLGYEVGETVMTRPDKSDTLLYAAFSAHNSEAARSSWDPMLVIAAALCPDGTDEELKAAGYDTVHGTAYVSPDDGSDRFVVSDGGPHRYLKKTVSDAWFEDVIKSALGN